jgi:uncharacterized membrane protein
MTLAPLLNASPAIQIHTFMALLAAALSVHQFTARRGGRSHRIIGYTWAALMMMTAASSFFIQNLRLWGPFSPIHLLSITTLIMVPSAIYAARQHKIVLHQKIMRSLVIFALITAGLFTLVPGRIMHNVVFGVGAL